MAKIKYNVKGVDSGGGPRVKPGMYRARIKAVEEDESKSGNGAMLVVTYEVLSEANGDKTEWKGQTVKAWVLLEHEASAFRLRQLLEAIGKVKGKTGEAGTLDTSAMEGVEVQIQVKGDKDDSGEYQPKIGKVLSLEAASADDEERGEEEDEEDDDTEPEEEEGDEEEIDLDELDRAELKALIKEQELGIKVLRSMSDDDLRAAITEALGGDEEEDEDEPEEEEEDEDEETIDLDELDRAGLKALIKEQGLEIRVLKSDDDDALRAKVAEALGGDEDEEEDETPEYGSWDVAKLNAELKQRGLPLKGAKAAKVAALVKDDKDDKDPF